MPLVCIVAPGVLAAKSPKLLLRILARRRTPVFLVTRAFGHNEVDTQEAALQHADALVQVAGIFKLPALQLCTHSFCAMSRNHMRGGIVIRLLHSLCPDQLILGPSMCCHVANASHMASPPSEEHQSWCKALETVMELNVRQIREDLMHL